MEHLDSMTLEERAQVIAERARDLVALAEQMGVALRIERVPLQPLNMGNMRHVVDAWPARHGPRQPK